MNIYLVGGAVRDSLLGLSSTDRDWVVVGSTPEEMLALGYRPVGKDFPVFLHPVTHEEYALARTERKSGPGYSGFTFHTSPDVSLRDDLRRRDLTVNAMAQDSQGDIFDPYGGQQDLENKILRHVSPAFAEDPLRILRTARFAARFHRRGFTIASETKTLMKKIVAAGEVSHLVAERVWQETARALMESAPAIYFQVLQESGALVSIMPLNKDIFDTSALALPALTLAADANETAPVRFACLYPEVPSVTAKKLRESFKVMRTPSAFQETALLINAHLNDLVHAQQNTTPGVVEALFQATDAYRKPERFANALRASYYLSKAKNEQLSLSKLEKIITLLKVSQSVSAEAIVAQGYKGKEVGEQLRIKRIETIRQQLSQ